MAVVIDGSNTPTAGGVVYGDGTEYASTAAGSAGGVLYSAGSSAPAFTAAGTSGQVLTSAGASAPTWATLSAGFTLGTTVSPSGTAIAEFTNIPSTAKVIYINYQAVSFTTGEVMRIQLGTSGAYVTSGYFSAAGQIGGTSPSSTVETSGFFLQYNGSTAAASTHHGSAVLTLQDASTNLWCIHGGSACFNSNSSMMTCGGAVTLTNALTRLKVIPSAGSGNFDAGTINIAYI